LNLKSPLFVALDLDSGEKALQLAESLAPYVGGFKIGPRLALRYGADFVRQVAEKGLVFLDMKYFDIPNTMLSAVKASFDAGATFVTVHSLAGKETLEALSALERELNEQRPFRILSVTLLTSFKQENLPGALAQVELKRQVEDLAHLSFFSGVRGLVCSPLEVTDLRKKFPQSFLVTPGIRRQQDQLGDQKRVMGPREALLAGASALVVGRPILEASDPVQVAKEFYEETKQALRS
jgi:orotidine-5'-phosphate decarboxylase